MHLNALPVEDRIFIDPPPSTRDVPLPSATRRIQQRAGTTRNVSDSLYIIVLSSHFPHKKICVRLSINPPASVLAFKSTLTLFKCPRRRLCSLINHAVAAQYSCALAMGVFQFFSSLFCFPPPPATRAGLRGLID